MVLIKPKNKSSSSSSSSRSGNTTRNYVSNNSSSSSNNSSRSSSNNSSTSSRAAQQAAEDAAARANQSAIMNPYLAQKGILPNPAAVTTTPVTASPIATPVTTPPVTTPVNSDNPNRYNPINPLTAPPGTPGNFIPANPTQTTNNNLSPTPSNNLNQTPQNNIQQSNTPVPGSVGVTYNQGNYTPNSSSAPMQNTNPGIGQQIIDGLTGKTFNEKYPNAKVNSVASTVGMFTVGAIGLFAGLKAAISGISKKTAVQTSMQVGLKPLDYAVSNIYSTAGNIAVNSATATKTLSWIEKVGIQLKKPPVIAGMIATSIVGAIGSYPFAGFLKEEALQTLSMGTKTAISNNDLTNAKAAQAQIKEVLNPDIWGQIKQGIPFVNVLNSLDEFYSAAQMKVAIDDKLIADMEIQQTTGETSDQKWERINTEQAAAKQASVDYYNQQRMLLVEWEREAAIEARNEDAAFWAREREKKLREETEAAKEQAAFWTAYKKASYAAASGYSSNYETPSKLNFGIL